MENSILITASEFGDAWPFTVDQGTLSCIGHDDSVEVLFTVDNVTYAVNGLAKQSGRYADIRAIWADSPSRPGLKKNIQPIIKHGLALCT